MANPDINVNVVNKEIDVNVVNKEISVKVTGATNLSVQRLQQKWEYKMEHVDGNKPVSLEVLNTAGKDGWELVNVVFFGNSPPANGEIIFKRPI